MIITFSRWGRKKAIICAAVVFTVGAIVMGAAPTKEVLLVGRIVLGMGIGKSHTRLWDSLGTKLVLNNAPRYGQYVCSCVHGRDQS